MPYTFQPDKMYRMPTHFGPRTGPRQGPDGSTFANVDTPLNTTVSASFLTDADALEAMLPECFTLDGEPVAATTSSASASRPPSQAAKTKCAGLS